MCCLFYAFSQNIHIYKHTAGECHSQGYYIYHCAYQVLSGDKDTQEKCQCKGIEHDQEAVEQVVRQMRVIQAGAPVQDHREQIQKSPDSNSNDQISKKKLKILLPARDGGA